MTDALRYAEALEVHLDEGGAFNQVNVRDLIRMVKGAESLNAELMEALEKAYAFIADEYADAESQALDGEHVSREARPVWNAICAALSRARSETPEGEG